MSIEVAEELAKRWMPGKREGSEREAWEHPRDVVELLQMGPFTIDEPTLMVAWLHDILEDGIKENGRPVTWGDLMAASLPVSVVDDVKALTRKTNYGFGGNDPTLEPKPVYLDRLRNGSPRAKMVKCADRICNLREGVATFKHERWVRYVGETYCFIYPLAKDTASVGGPKAPAWFRQELLRAAAARPLL